MKNVGRGRAFESKSKGRRGKDHTFGPWVGTSHTREEHYVANMLLLSSGSGQAACKVRGRGRTTAAGRRGSSLSPVWAPNPLPRSRTGTNFNWRLWMWVLESYSGKCCGGWRVGRRGEGQSQWLFQRKNTQGGVGGTGEDKDDSRVSWFGQLGGYDAVHQDREGRRKSRFGWGR